MTVSPPSGANAVANVWHAGCSRREAMAEIRGHTGVNVQTVHVEKRELPDELAHAHVVFPLDPRQEAEVGRESEERIEDESHRRADAPAERTGDEGESSGDSSGSSDGEPDHFVFVDGKPLAVHGGRPAERPFDRTALVAGYHEGALDLVADGELVRMIFNGRLRLSGLTMREDRRAASSLLSKLRDAPMIEDFLPYGPLHLRFDLGPRLIPPIETLTSLRGVTFEDARDRMLAALAEKRDDDFVAMTRELADAHEFMIDIAELNPDLLFSELKLLFANLFTPAFGRFLPDLVDARGEVNAEQWVQGWERLDALGRTKERDAISAFDPALIRFLLSSESGWIFGPTDGTVVPSRLDEGREAAVRFIRWRVLSARLLTFERTRAEHLSQSLTRDIPRGATFAGDATFGAVIFALARADQKRFEERVLKTEHVEQEDGPTVVTSLGAVGLEELRAFARCAAKEPRGFFDRLASEDAADARAVDPLAAAAHAALIREGFEEGLFGAPSERIAELLYGRPVARSSIRSDDRAALASLAEQKGALVAVRGEAREAVARWGSPSMFGTSISPADLARATSNDVQSQIDGLTHLANTLEHAGVPPPVIDEIMGLKSRLNRRQPDDHNLSSDLRAYLAAHVKIDPFDREHEPVFVLLDERGEPQFEIASSIEAIEAIEPVS